MARTARREGTVLALTLVLLCSSCLRAASTRAHQLPARLAAARPARVRARLGLPPASSPPVLPPVLVPLRDALAEYDALLLDQFGVLHDGLTPYAGASAAVRHLQRTARKRIIILSNSSKRRIETVNRLHALGLGMCTWLDGASVADGVPLITVITSGDIVWNELRERMRQPPAPTGAQEVGEATAAAAVVATEARASPDPFDVPGGFCVVYGNGDDDDQYVATAGCIPSTVELADFILARGMFELRTRRGDGGAQPFDAAAHVEPLLEAALARGLPMIVANPDLVRPDGRDSPMPGVLGAVYERMGGDVRYIGKPHPRVYQAAKRQLAGEGVEEGRVVAVGDSMEHDILGARRAGLDAILVTGGVHAAELGVAQGAAEAPTAERLAAFLSRYPRDEWPTHVCAGFVLD